MVGCTDQAALVVIVVISLAITAHGEDKAIPEQAMAEVPVDWLESVAVGMALRPITAVMEAPDSKANLGVAAGAGAEVEVGRMAGEVEMVVSAATAASAGGAEREVAVVWVVDRKEGLGGKVGREALVAEQAAEVLMPRMSC